ncbi:hypothetical protein OG21DRAFT_1586552 [Imleria badia]|nr:hypothetical protein OG21DRAFT_1586552 [Imleria badia]
METEKVDVTSIPYSDIPPFAYDDRCWNQLLFNSELSLLTPEPRSMPPYSDRSFSHGWPDPESSTVHSDPSTHPYFDFRRGGNARPSVLLDTGEWSPSLSFVSPRATSEAQFSSMDVGSDVSLSLLDGRSNDFGETFASGNMLAAYMASKSQAILHTQPVPDLSRGFSYHRANLGTDHHHAPFQTSGALVSSPSSGSTEDGRQPLNPVVIYRPLKRKGSGGRRSQRACAINIEGMWIEKEDLNFGADHGSSMISVYECQWAASGNPCGMWIIPSRRSVGNHIRATKRCTKTRFNCHVMTVHFGEAFHCQGCDQEFPRKDVYNQHVEVGETCRVAGAAMIWEAKQMPSRWNIYTQQEFDQMLMLVLVDTLE